MQVLLVDEPITVLIYLKKIFSNIRIITNPIIYMLFLCIKENKMRGDK